MVEQINTGPKWSKEELDNIMEAAKNEIDIRDRSYHFSTYPRTFVASEFTTWLVEKEFAANREDAVELGKALVADLKIVHVVRDHDFKDEYLFFRFMEHMKDKGHVKQPEDGSKPLSWRQFMENPDLAGRDLHPEEVK